MSNDKCMRCGGRVGWVSVVVNLALTVLKLAVGFLTGSKAVMADALHSAACIFTSFAVFVARKLTGKPNDDAHPYGHGKVEFLAAGAVSVVILILTGILVVEALKHLVYQSPPPPHISAILVSVVSVTSNEMLFRYFRCVGTRLNSQTIRTVAWANRADAFSSSAVLIGVIASWFGVHYFDPIAALVVAGIIVKVYVTSIIESLEGLMDHSVSPETLAAVKRTLREERKVEEIRYVRARLLGNKIWVELGIRVAPGHTVTECHSLAADLQRRVVEKIHDVEHVMVEFEPVVG